MSDRRPPLARTGPDAGTARHFNGTAALALAALLFGSTFLVVKDAVARAEPVGFLAVRFSIAAAVLWPMSRRRPGSGAEWLHGGAAGLLLFAGYTLQTVGLQRINSSTSAFLTYLLVIIVPLLEWVFAGSKPRWTTVASLAVAVGGLVLLTGGEPGGFGIGAAETLACAVCFAAHLVVVGRVARHHDPLRLTFVQLVTVAALCWIASPFNGALAHFDGSVTAAAAFTGVFATAAAFGLMVAGQRVVSSARAAIVLLIEPVSAAVLGLATGEHLGLRGLAGAAAILAAVAISEAGAALRPGFERLGTDHAPSLVPEHGR